MEDDGIRRCGNDTAKPECFPVERDDLRRESPLCELRRQLARAARALGDDHGLPGTGCLAVRRSRGSERTPPWRML